MREYECNTGLGAVLSTAPFSATGMGGQMAHSYGYDGLYRLVNATGNYTGASGKTASYSLDMQYDNLHNIVSKKQHVQQSNIVFDGTLKAGYDLTYNYDKPFQISTLQDENYRTEGDVNDDKITNEHAYKYDANGNLVYINTAKEKLDGTKDDGSGEKKYLWDEENRLLAANTNGFISSYWYDASGERVIKASGDDEGIYVNGLFSGARTETSNFTAYINPYLVVSRGGNYTKHIYIGSQRIVSKLGDLDSYGQDPRRIPYAGADVEGASVDYAGKYKESQQTIKDRYGDFEVPSYGKDNDDYVNGGGFCCDDSPSLRAGAIGNGNDNPEIYQYYYHSDHLGSTSLITDLDGEVVQHVEYVPFGEVFIEERNNKWNTPYLFNAKELDEETGLYYYGARYYDGRSSVWLSVDPLTEKYPGISGYAYCGNNPVNYIDPTGMDSTYFNSEGDIIYSCGENPRVKNYYVIKTTQTTDQMYADVVGDERGNSNPISSDQATTAMAEVSNGNVTGSHMDNFVEIPNRSQGMNALDIISDDGLGGTASQNNSETAFNFDSYTNMPYNVVVGNASDPSIPNNTVSVASRTNHAHPSGTRNGSSWVQPPSSTDIQNGYPDYNFNVWGMGSQTVYIYNSTGVIATVPFCIYY